MLLGEIRIRSGLRVFMRTASRYDDSRILFLPDLRLRIVLGQYFSLFFVVSAFCIPNVNDYRLDM